MSRGRGLRIRAPGKPALKQDESARHELAMLLRNVRPGQMVTNYQFAVHTNGRKWAWDIADLEHKLAIEVDGGIWVQGAHAHPTTIIRNMEKRNWGARLGWRVLAFTPDQVRDGSAFDFVLAVVSSPQQLTVRESLQGGISAKTTPRARKHRRRA